MSHLLLLMTLTLQSPVSVPVAPAESLAVTTVGDGPPVVLIPGLFGSSYGFRHVMVDLESAGFQAVAVEPLGMGTSSRPADADYALTAQARRVAAVLDTLGLREAVFVGHSLGASIALRVTYRRPGLVRGIVSIEGGPGETATTSGFRKWMRFAPAARVIDVRPMMRQMLLREMRGSSFDDAWVTDDVIRGYTIGMVRDHRATIRAYQAMAASVEPERLYDRLPDIACPVVLLVGSSPHRSGPPPEEVTAMATRLPSFRMDTVAQAGYFVHEEQPDAVVRAVVSVRDAGPCGTSPPDRD